MGSIQCPLCGFDSSVTWFQLSHARILRCGSRCCGLGFVEQQPTDQQLGSYYEEFYYPEHGGDPIFENSTDSKMEQHFSFLNGRLNLAGKTVLDYGCGVGGFLDVARKNGCNPMGVEYDDVARSTASSKGFRVDREIGSYDDLTFDFIYMNDVIEHLRDPVASLQQVRHCLKPGSAVFIVTMNMRGIKSRVIGKRWDVVTNPTHLWFYDERSLARSLNKAGFASWSVERFPVEFSHHGILRRNVQRLLQRFGLDTSLRMLAWRGED